MKKLHCYNDVYSKILNSYHYNNYSFLVFDINICNIKFHYSENQFGILLISGFHACGR